MVDIRPATPADVPAIRELVVAAYRHYVPRIGREPAPMTADYAAVVAAGSAWVAEADGRLAGLVVLVPGPDHLLLENVAVDPARQGIGVGSALLRFADGRARALGLPAVNLYTNALMTENIAYYPRHGYVETHRSEEHGFHRVFFTKRLD
jgi:GNAT superfamily N-acetyltransferase